MSSIIAHHLSAESYRDSPRYPLWRQLHHLFLDYRTVRQRYEAAFHYGDHGVVSGNAPTDTVRPGLMQLPFDDPRALTIIEERKRRVSETRAELIVAVDALLDAPFLSFLGSDEKMYLEFLLLNERRDDWESPVWGKEDFKEMCS